MQPPPSHTPLIALPVLVIDLETTGLNVKKDRVVQVAIQSLLGDATQDDPAMNTFVNPGCDIPASATNIHHITNSDVETSPGFVDIAKQLGSHINGRIIVGHNIGFDIGILRHEFARKGLSWQEPVSLDVRQIIGALIPSLPDLSLETITTNFGIKIENRHSAMGDCNAAAQIWQQLVSMLRDNDIRTLGEAQALAKQRQDLILRQHEAGWFDQPDGLVTLAPAPGISAAEKIDSYVFEHHIKDLMQSPPQTIDATNTLTSAAKKMLQQQVGCLLITDEKNYPQGIVTESDILHAMANNDADPATILINDVMQSPVECIHKNDMLYRALARMDRLHICHLCVTDASEQALGMISQRDLLQYRARGTQMLSDAIDYANDTSTLAAAFSQTTAVATQLRNEHLDGSDIARVISTELRALTARAASICEQQMHDAGKGQAPADWCVFVLGSGGRGESLLTADQDNALIHNGKESDDIWFAEFGERLAVMLNDAGIPFCEGKVMTSTPEWRGTVEQWNTRVDNWIRRANTNDLLNIDIFLDLIPVAGQLELAKRLHRDAINVAADTPAFINLMAQSVQRLTPRFSMLGKLASEAGRINLKRDGLLPLVSFARTLAVSIGSTSRATPERLQDLIAAKRIAKKDAQRLITLHQQLLSYTLDQQLQDISTGITASNKVISKSIEAKEYSILIKGLKHLNTMVNEIQSFISH